MDSWVQESRGGSGSGTTHITPSDPQAKFLLPVTTTLCSTGLEVLVPEEGMLLLGDTTRILLNWKVRLPCGHFGLLLPLSQQAKNRVIVLAGAVDLDIKMRSAYYCIIEVRKVCMEYRRSIRASLSITVPCD
uniref:Uncharacterized protein n=1 Tax=Callithrix jacchus TaxID=9483 RepID=A0A5F4W566_CALJA